MDRENTRVLPDTSGRKNRGEPMNVTRSHSPPGPRRARDQRAASLVEYVMMIALIALVCITAISYFGGTNSGSVNDSADSIVNAG